MNKKLFLDENQKLFEKEVGYIIYSIDKNTCSIDFIEIDNYRKNKGQGSKLLDDFINTMNKKSINEFYLEAILTEKAVFGLEELISFYEKFGFKECDRFEDDILRIYMSLKV